MLFDCCGGVLLALHLVIPDPDPDPVARLLPLAVSQESVCSRYTDSILVYVDRQVSNFELLLSLATRPPHPGGLRVPILTVVF